MSALIAFDWSWHLECRCTIGWVSGEGGASGGRGLDVVGGVEADLAAAQLSFTPALLVLLSQLQQLLAWKEHDGKSDHSTAHWGGGAFIHDRHHQNWRPPGPV